MTLAITRRDALCKTRETSTISLREIALASRSACFTGADDKTSTGARTYDGLHAWAMRMVVERGAQPSAHNFLSEDCRIVGVQEHKIGK
mmetsp:Transcript_42716/g.106309  ORF Transcript_42716/g.106309 Transcript_42716/m.106309 type:complete len:89 (+) Transcript_42716:74-340(+)